MYETKSFMEKHNTLLGAVLFVIIVFCAGAAAGYCIGIRNTRTTAGTDLHTNGKAAQGVRDEIDSARSAIGAAKSGIDNAAATAGRIEARISDAQERAEYVKGAADEGRRIIAECQSILREVRTGGKAGKIAN